MSKVYQQCWKEWAAWFAQKGVPNNDISVPKLPDFLVDLFWVGLAYNWYILFCSFYLFGASSSSQGL